MRVHRLWQAKEEERIKVAAIVQAGNLGKGRAGERVGLGEDQGGHFSAGMKSRTLLKWKPLCYD